MRSFVDRRKYSAFNKLIQDHKRTLFPYRFTKELTRLKSELDDMEIQGVIRKVDMPADLVNTIVIVEKPNTRKLMICLDPKYFNKAYKREHF